MRRMLLAVLVAVSLPAVAQSQNPAKPDSYLRLVAAAVSGYSAGGAVYVVICETGNKQYKVIAVFGTAAEAQNSANANKTNQYACYVEGPYYNSVGTPNADMTALRYGGGCKKGPDSDCIADSTAASAFIAPLGSIEAVTITYRLRDGSQRVEQFDPRKVEAIFFTMAAVDRMLIPYYVRVYGLNGAAARREVLLNRYGVRDLNVNQAGPR